MDNYICLSILLCIQLYQYSATRFNLNKYLSEIQKDYVNYHNYCRFYFFGLNIIPS